MIDPNHIIRRLYNTYPVRKFLNGPFPSWAVLAADILAVIVSCTLVYIFSGTSATPDHAIWSNPVMQSAVIVANFTLLSLAFKTYRSILRLSAFEDVERIINLLVVLALALLVERWAVLQIWGIPYVLSVWNIFVICVFTFTLMLMLRLSSKYAFRILSVQQIQQRERVIILSSWDNTTGLGNALLNEVDGRFKPVAYLTLSTKAASHNVAGGIPYVNYDPDTVADVFSRFNSSTLLILPIHMKLMRDGVADVFLRNNIKLLMVNSISEVSSLDNSSPANPSSHIREVSIEDLLGREPIVNDNPHIKPNIMGQTIMVTGAAGSIGSEIVRQLAALGARHIVMVDQAETPMHDLQIELDKLDKGPATSFFVADITNRPRIESIIAATCPRYIFHAAAYKHVPMMENNPMEAILTNVFGTKNVADLALKYGVEKFVMISTDKAVNPTNIMGASKRIAEIYVQSLFNNARQNTDSQTTAFITTRFGNVLGSNGSVIPLFRRQIEAGGPVTVTHRDIIRYFMTIPEACSLVLEAGCMGAGGEIYIFDMGQPVKIYDLATRMISLAGLRPGVDIEIVETGLRPGEKLFEELLNDRETTMPTSHHKIMIAKVRQYRLREVLQHLGKLHDYAYSGNVHRMVAEMKLMVPEYRSQNSQFEQIDREIDTELHKQDKKQKKPSFLRDEYIS